MLPVIACVLALQVPLQQPPRLRTILPNGAVILVQREPTLKKLCLKLFVSARNSLGTPKTHGLRHLLEHLTAKGPDGSLDLKLETHGAFLTAETLRDATVYSITLRQTDLNLGIEAVSELMQLGETSKDAIAIEAAVIRQEDALQPPDEKFSRAAWAAAFGDEGLDPMGDMAVIAAATPEELHDLHRAEFIGPNLVLTISGDVDLDAATAAAANVLGTAAADKKTPFASRDGRPGEAQAEVQGEARAAFVNDFEAPGTASRLAAAFGIASELTRGFVTYTPSERGGLIIVGLEGGAANLGKKVDIDPAAIFASGRALARSWVERQIGPENDGYLRGLLLSEGAGLRPETLVDNLMQMSFQQFAAGVNAYKPPQTVEVHGK